MAEIEKAVSDIILQLRRGTQVLSVLSQLQEPKYGYSLIQSLSESGLEIEQNTLYPLMRRLESQGLLDSQWSVEEARPRRYYVLSDDGKAAMKRIEEEWNSMVLTINGLLKQNKKEEK